MGGCAAVLFDLDGVLVDSRAAITGCMNHALVTHGLERRDPKALEHFIGPPLAEGFAELAGREPGDRLVGALIGSYRERYAVESLRSTVAVPGISEVLHDLDRRCEMAVATSKQLPLAEPLLGVVGLRRHFDAIVGPDLGGDGDKAAIICEALDRLGRPAAAVMVGDRSHDVIGAHANGIPCIGVTWGIGGEGELVGAGADRVVEGPEQLLAVIDQGLPTRG